MVSACSLELGARTRSRHGTQPAVAALCDQRCAAFREGGRPEPVDLAGDALAPSAASIFDVGRQRELKYVSERFIDRLWICTPSEMPQTLCHSLFQWPSTRSKYRKSRKEAKSESRRQRQPCTIRNSNPNSNPNPNVLLANSRPSARDRMRSQGQGQGTKEGCCQARCESSFRQSNAVGRRRRARFRRCWCWCGHCGKPRAARRGCRACARAGGDDLGHRGVDSRRRNLLSSVKRMTLIVMMMNGLALTMTDFDLYSICVVRNPSSIAIHSNSELRTRVAWATKLF